jgi:hypothetical protein
MKNLTIACASVKAELELRGNELAEKTRKFEGLEGEMEQEKIKVLQLSE